MGWFDEQIRERKAHDEDMLRDSFAGIAASVSGRKVWEAFNRSSKKNQAAIDEILRFYHHKPVEIPEMVTDPDERLEYALRPYGIMRRRVRLTDGWYRDAAGAMLAVRKSDGLPVALLPSGFAGYVYYDEESGKKHKISSKNSELFEDEAIIFYPSLPPHALEVKDLLAYSVRTLSLADFLLFALSSLAITLLGLLTPKLTELLFSTVLDTGSIQLLASIAVFLVSATITSSIINGTVELFKARINTKLGVYVQSAVMMRVLSLPSSFFRQTSAGELAAKTQNIGELCNNIMTAVLSTGLMAVFSLTYLIQIFDFAPSLMVPAVVILLLRILYPILVGSRNVPETTRLRLQAIAKENSVCYSVISGIQKIRLAGAEKRIFAKWGQFYARLSSNVYKTRFPYKNLMWGNFLTLAGTIIFYYNAVTDGVDVADFYAFTSSFASISAAFTALSGMLITLEELYPTLETVAAVLEAVPETDNSKRVVTRLSGSIELNNVSFRYDDSMPNVINNLSLKIRSGSYVALVGSSGCGKSTLMKLLIGMESPQKGAIYYDGRDISRLDLKSLRRKIGVVMQDGKLFSGDIFSNIAICAPQLTLDEAWEAARIAGLEEDIKKMPMGMHTLISEGSGGISGGQRQRLMIARAIAAKPRVLIFDEATSALDNITQKQVTEALDSLRCTRIVIAHRLSTIRQCDRILYLEAGQIAEEGTYEELMGRNGKFAALVERQQID